MSAHRFGFALIIFFVNLDSFDLKGRLIVIFLGRSDGDNDFVLVNEFTSASFSSNSGEATINGAELEILWAAKKINTTVVLPRRTDQARQRAEAESLTIINHARIMPTFVTH